MRDRNSARIFLSGITLVELLTALALMGIVLSMGALGVRAFRARGNVMNGVRCVTAAFQAARYRSIGLNRRQRVEQANDRHLNLQEINEGGWETIQVFTAPEDVFLSMNARPVFYPEGHVVPLCSVYVTSEQYRRRVSISLAGRIHVTSVP